MMIAFVVAVLAYGRAFFMTRHHLGLEIVALRQQLGVFQRKHPRPRLREFDRLFWIGLRRLWTGWASALIIVKPDTVVSWHRVRFRLFWRLRSRPQHRVTSKQWTVVLDRHLRSNFLVFNRGVVEIYNHGMEGPIEPAEERVQVALVRPSGRNSVPALQLLLKDLAADLTQ